MGKVPWESDPGLVQLRETLSKLLFFGRKLLEEFQRQVEENQRLRLKIRKLERKHPVAPSTVRRRKPRNRRPGGEASAASEPVTSAPVSSARAMRHHKAEQETSCRETLKSSSTKYTSENRATAAPKAKKGTGLVQTRSSSSASRSRVSKKSSERKSEPEKPRIFAVPVSSADEVAPTDDWAQTMVDALALLDRGHPLHTLISGRARAMLGRRRRLERRLRTELAAANSRADEADRRRAELAAHLRLLRMVYYRFVSDGVELPPALRRELDAQRDEFAGPELLV